MNPKKLESSLKIEKKNSVNEKRGEKSPVKKVVENAFSYSNSNAVIRPPRAPMYTQITKNKIQKQKAYKEKQNKGRID